MGNTTRYTAPDWLTAGLLSAMPKGNVGKVRDASFDFLKSVEPSVPFTSETSISRDLE
jgi:hypothetical protein